MNASAIIAAPPELIGGLGVTLELTIVALGVGLPLGAVLALASRSARRSVRWPVFVIVELGRGSPVIVLLQLVYYGLPASGLVIAAVPAVWIALAGSSAAYSSEIFRGALDSVPSSQIESARALGLDRRAQLYDVIAPQALRVAGAPVLGLSVQMFQATSLAFALSVPELLSRAYSLGSETFEYGPWFAVTGVLYAIVALPLMRLVPVLERRTGNTRSKKGRHV